MAENRPSAKFTISFVAGLLLVPMAAVMAVALMSDAEPEAAVAEEPTTTTVPEVQQIVFGAVAEATADDLAVACGPAGLELVSAETDGTITPVQQAALDALRPICESQGTPLPGKPEPEAIVQTVRVYNQAAPATTAPTTTSTQQPESAQPAPSTTQAGEQGGDGEEGRRSTAGYTQEQYVQVHDQAVQEIEAAVARGGDPEKIAEAKSKLAKAEGLAAAGNWQEATVNAYEAIGKAREALGEEED